MSQQVVARRILDQATRRLTAADYVVTPYREATYSSSVDCEAAPHQPALSVQTTEGEVTLVLLYDGHTDNWIALGATQGVRAAILDTIWGPADAETA